MWIVELQTLKPMELRRDDQMKCIVHFGFITLALFGLGLSGCAAIPPQPAVPILQLEEHRLAGAPELDPLHFQPIIGTQEEVLAEHASDRAMVFSKAIITAGGEPAISSPGDSGDFLAVLSTSTSAAPVQTVRVLHGGKVIFETDAGLPSPVLPLQALWTYDDHWALEILLSNQSTWAGEIFIDGKSINELKGYDDAFGLQLLAGKPFFFFGRYGHTGYSYDGQETVLTYDEIPHYRCCGESQLNPLQARNMVAFFATREKEWYYVELGDFKVK